MNGTGPREPAGEVDWRLAVTGRRPERLLEVAIFAGRVEIVEHYGEGAADRLAAALRDLGIQPRLDFVAPCG